MFTEEVLYIFVCEVESLINNHPVAPSSDDINDYQTLAPNHLMLGNSSSNVKMMKFTTGKNGVQCRKQLIFFGINGVRSTNQQLFNKGNRTETRKI